MPGCCVSPLVSLGSLRSDGGLGLSVYCAACVWRTARRGHGGAPVPRVPAEKLKDSHPTWKRQKSRPAGRKGSGGRGFASRRAPWHRALPRSPQTLPPDPRLRARLPLRSRASTRYRTRPVPSGRYRARRPYSASGAASSAAPRARQAQTTAITVERKVFHPAPAPCPRRKAPPPTAVRNIATAARPTGRARAPPPPSARQPPTNDCFSPKQNGSTCASCAHRWSTWRSRAVCRFGPR